MRIETICTGDELLTGLTSDTNSRFFQERLLERAGLTVRRSVVVGDLKADIIEALNDCATRCDVVLVSGGLGPTTDDITAGCAAEAAGVPLVESPEVMAHLEARFRRRGMALTPNNRRQAQVPEGSELVLNDEGAAPLIIQRRGTCTFFFVPGVPREYEHLVERHVVPRIAMMAGAKVRVLRVMKTVNLPESHLDARMSPLLGKHPHITFGYRTHPPENHLKLLAEAATRDEALAAIAEVERDARAALGDTCFGADHDTLPSVVLSALRGRKQRLALAESCTGGLCTALLTDVPGASDVVVGGAVAYAESVKTQWLKVRPELLAEFGAVSAECAEAMAIGSRTVTGVEWGLSITGYAGPTGGTERDPVGTVYFGVSSESVTRVERTRFHGDRDRVRRFAAHFALDLLRRTLTS